MLSSRNGQRKFSFGIGGNTYLQITYIHTGTGKGLIVFSIFDLALNLNFRISSSRLRATQAYLFNFLSLFDGSVYGINSLDRHGRIFYKHNSMCIHLQVIQICSQK